MSRSMGEKRIAVLLFFLAHVALTLLLAVVLVVPANHVVSSSESLLFAITLIELVYLVQFANMRRKAQPSAASAIMIFVWLAMAAWELATAKLKLLSVLMFPALENIFAVFAEHGYELAFNAASSIELLVVGFLGGVLLGAMLGIVVGWFIPLKRFFYPVARVLAPIPPMVMSPYVILVMPTFRAASIVLVGITVFMFVFLSTIEQVGAIDQEILDSARMMRLDGIAMVRDILIPYVAPSVIVGLKLYLIMGFMMLIYAETMGSTYGLGHWICINHTVANYANLIAGFIEIGVLVVAVNKLVELAQTKLIRWK